MSILLGFAPYLVFFLVMRVVSVDGGWWASSIVAVLNAGRDWAPSGALKVLDVGTVALFVTLAIFTMARTGNCSSPSTGASPGRGPRPSRGWWRRTPLSFSSPGFRCGSMSR